MTSNDCKSQCDALKMAQMSQLITSPVEDVTQSMEDPAMGSAASEMAHHLAVNGKGTIVHMIQGVGMGRSSVIEIDIELHDDGKRCEAVKLVDLLYRF